jgi:hypothetical protein
VFVPDLASFNQETITSLERNEKVAVAGVLNALSCRPETERTERGTALDHPEATISWDALQNQLMQAPYLEPEGTPSAPQSLEKRCKQIRWFKFKDPRHTLDSSIIRQVSAYLVGFCGLLTLPLSS